LVQTALYKADHLREDTVSLHPHRARHARSTPTGSRWSWAATAAYRSGPADRRGVPDADFGINDRIARQYPL